MADKLHFDQDTVLNRFLKIFWSKGYRATTTKELAKNAGISESSLFNTYNNKRAIYIDCLRRYRENSAFTEILRNEPSAIAGIQKYFQVLGSYASDSSRTSGCMITNATVELSQERDIGPYLQSVHKSYDKEFQQALDRAVTQGELSKTADTLALAQFLSNSGQGLRVLAKTNPSKKKVANIVSMTLSVLESSRTKVSSLNK